MVIVGGGVIGLSLAYALAREGVAATVLDRAEMGRAASWAGAGIISPAATKPTTNPLSALRSRSARLYPEWSAALAEETGIDNGYRLSGGVDVAADAEERDGLAASAIRWQEEGITFQRLGPGEFLEVEPALNPGLVAAYYLPDRAQVRNPRHVRALTVAATRRGAILRPGLGATGLRIAAGRVVAIETAQGEIPCGWAVVAAGPWSESILKSAGLLVPTPPIKGQIVLLRGERPILTRIVEHGANYLVPRDDGRILAGATEEDAGFDTRTTPEALRDLVAEARRLCPALVGAEVERSWAGLRPGSLDGRPYLGRAPGFENLVIATGHRRAGLQLSPATAEALADLILGRPPRLDLAPFLPGRTTGPVLADAFRS